MTALTAKLPSIPCARLEHCLRPCPKSSLFRVGLEEYGQILLSQTTAALVRDDLPVGASLRELGAHRLKDLQRPEPLMQLVHPELPTEFTSSLSGADTRAMFPFDVSHS